MRNKNAHEKYGQLVIDAGFQAMTSKVLHLFIFPLLSLHPFLHLHGDKSKGVECISFISNTGDALWFE